MTPAKTIFPSSQVLSGYEFWQDTTHPSTAPIHIRWKTQGPMRVPMFFCPHVSCFCFTLDRGSTLDTTQLLCAELRLPGPFWKQTFTGVWVMEQLATNDNTGISGQLGFLAWTFTTLSFLSPVPCSTDSYLFPPRMSIKTTVPFAAVQAAPFTFFFLPEPLKAGEKVSPPSRQTKANGIFS